MADFTVSTDVDTLMKSADNATIKTQLDVVSPESVMNPMIEGMGLLNAFKGAAAAYSLRDINGSNPNVVRVRRTNNPDEADFTAADLASGAMLAWVGTGATDDGHVVTWYDQSGNGNDATQGTTTSQPKIVDGGVYLGEVKFDGVNDKLVKGTFTQGALSQPNSIFAAGSMVGATGFIYDGVNSWSRNLLFKTSGSFYMFAGTSQIIAPEDDNVHLFSNVFNQTTSDAYIDGTLEASSVDVGTHTMGGITIGARYATSFGQVSIKEIIIYSSDQSAPRTYIEYNINNAYSIY